MSGLRTRLAQIERAALLVTGVGRCAMCGGDPNAVLLVVHELVRSGSRIVAIRKTGEIYLAEESVGRITEDLHDLRCVGCGTKARKTLVMYTPELKFEQKLKGKKLAALSAVGPKRRG
jgi:hypothetical protein